MAYLLYYNMQMLCFVFGFRPISHLPILRSQADHSDRFAVRLVVQKLEFPAFGIISALDSPRDFSNPSKNFHFVKEKGRRIGRRSVL